MLTNALLAKWAQIPTNTHAHKILWKDFAEVGVQENIDILEYCEIMFVILYRTVKTLYCD